MFRVVDLVARAILFVVNLLVLLRSELSAVGCAIGRYLVIDVRLTILDVRGLAGRHRTVADALRDPLLLIVTAGADLVVAVLRIGGVVLVVVDRAAQVVLLLVDLLVLRLCKVSAIGLPVAANLMIEIGLAAFQIAGFARRQAAVRNAVRDPTLLVEAPAVH